MRVRVNAFMILHSVHALACMYIMQILTCTCSGIVQCVHIDSSQTRSASPPQLKLAAAIPDNTFVCLTPGLKQKRVNNGRDQAIR